MQSHSCNGVGGQGRISGDWVTAEEKAENKAARVGTMKSIFALVLWGLFTWAVVAR